MNRSMTFRTQLTMNVGTLLLVALMFLASNTFANPSAATNTVSATATTTISYQGHLTNTSGTPVSATLPMTFNLYAAPTGGTTAWTELRSGSNAVPVSNGLFNVALGSLTPIPVSLLSTPLWLGVSVNGDAEMSPRERLDGGYAAVAGTVPDGSITSSKLGLQHGRQCLTSGVQINSTNKGNVPGTNLDFLLDQPALVLISIEGVASLNPAPTNTLADRYEIALHLDSVRKTLHAAWSGYWLNLDAQRVIPLSAGTHTLSVMAYPESPSGVITFYSNGADTSFTGNQLCVNYVVLGNQ